MDPLRCYSSYDLGFRVFEFLIPFIVGGSCTEILVSWIITQVSHDIARVLLCYFLMNEVSCSMNFQKYCHYCARSNKASFPKSLITKHTDAQSPDGNLPHFNHGHNGNEPSAALNNKESTGANYGDDVDTMDVEDGMGGNDGGNNDDGDGEVGEGNHEEDFKIEYEVVLERRTIDGHLINFIGTPICALDYGSWNEFAGAIYNFRREWSNHLDIPEVALVDLLFCWPGSYPTYGLWEDGVFISLDWHVDEWNLVNNRIDMIVLQETGPDDGDHYDDANGENNEEGADNGAQNDSEGANNGAQNDTEGANNSTQNGEEGADAERNEGEGENAAQNNEGGANDQNKAAVNDGGNGKSAVLVRNAA